LIAFYRNAIFSRVADVENCIGVTNGNLTKAVQVLHPLRRWRRPETVPKSILTFRFGARFARERNWLVGMEGFGDPGEYDIRSCADELGGRDDKDRDERCDQGIFDHGHAALVATELR